jgi:hypothetical protein
MTTIRLEIIEGDYDPTDPIQRIAPSGLRVGIMQELAIDLVHGRWEARGAGYLGQGQYKDAAILDWLAHRIGAQV